MAAKTYPVGCECGATIHVPGTSAGTTFTCKCGRTVEIPGLARLKASVGEAVVSAGFELEQLIQAGSLPLEMDCVTCGRHTDRIAIYDVLCERAVVDTGSPPLWQWLLVLPFVGCVGVLTGFLFIFRWRDPPTVHGHDITYRLPVRVCERCMADLTTPAAVKETMRETPIYARLLDRYPNAAITNAD